MARPIISPIVESRFWSFVEKRGPDECWPWTGALGGKYAKVGRGYAQLRVGGTLVRCTHIAWFLATGEWPIRHMLHSCDNPPCVNARHLHEGDDTMNQREAVARGLNHNVNLTHCPQGHEYSGDNLYLTPREGWRQCRECSRTKKRERRQMVKATA